MDKEQNSSRDENNNDEKLDKFEKIVIGLYLTPILIGIVFFAVFFFTQGYSNIDLFLGLCVFNGIAASFIVIIFIFSFIKLIGIYDGFAVKLCFYCIWINWIICFLGAISIVSVFGINNITNNFFYELIFIFFTFVGFSVIADIIMLYGSSY